MEAGCHAARTARPMQSSGNAQITFLKLEQTTRYLSEGFSV
jgi:hypothetical protein